MPITLFCPDCKAYLSPSDDACPSCSWQRPPSMRPPAPGQPLWQAHLPGPAGGDLLVYGDLLLVPWGQRRGSRGGGILALERSTGATCWELPTSHGLAAGLTARDGKVYFATLGAPGGGAELVCCQIESGAVLWSQALSAGAWSAPLVGESRLHVGCEDGQVHCFDLRQGEPVYNWPVHLDPGRSWLAPYGSRMAAVTERGLVYLLVGDTGEVYPHRPWDAGGRITSPPVRGGDWLYFGMEGGRLAALDLRNGQVSTLADGLERVVAAPLLVDRTLYVGGHDRRLHAIELPGARLLWETEFAHSISRPPYLADGMLVVCVNGGETFLLDAETGEAIWRFKPEGEIRMMSSPLIQDEVIYLATDHGDAYALPWHLGHYEWAGSWLQSRGKMDCAAEYFALEAYFTRDPARRENMYAQAVACWEGHGEPEWAARLWEGLGFDQEAVDCYCRAAKARRGDNPLLAAEYYDLASKLYWQLEEPVKAADYAREAARLGRWPRLRLRHRTDPKLTQGEAGQITIIMENAGYAEATDLFLRLGGSLEKPVYCQILQPLPADAHFDVTVDGVILTKPLNELRFEVEYRHRSMRKRAFTSILSMSLEARPPKINVKLGDSVLSEIHVKVADSNQREVNIEFGDQVKNQVEFEISDGE